MNWQDYKTQAHKAFIIHDVDILTKLQCPIGIAIEIGELKDAFNFKAFSKEKVSIKNTSIKEELGDILFYVANLEVLINTPIYTLQEGAVPFPIEKLEESSTSLLRIYLNATYQEYNKEISYSQVSGLLRDIRKSEDAIAYENMVTSEQIQQKGIDILKIYHPERFIK